MTHNEWRKSLGLPDEESYWLDDHGAWLDTLPGFMEWYKSLSANDRFRFASEAEHYWATERRYQFEESDDV